MHSHKVLRIASQNPSLQDKLSKELGISKILAQILFNRGLSTVASAHDFLNTSTKGFGDPMLFSDMPKALNLIRKSAGNKEKVMLFGDYDVDGLTAVALLKDTLGRLGLDVMSYIPHRIKEGYGLNKNILHIARQNNIKLLITVDCGTSNHSQIEELRRHDIEVIVTDHHEPAKPELPRASCIINPKIKDCGYKYRDLAGVGVAYKLAQAISGSTLLEELDLVCLGTIADSVPLTGENRIIAKEGLNRLTTTKREGLKALIKNAGIEGRKFSSTYVSFILAPRLNASGRMDYAQASLDLLMSQTKDDAAKFAVVLDSHNRQRQKVEGKILEEAEAIINKEINFTKHKVIVIAKEDWHQGVLGIVASKLADKFYRPAIVISLAEPLCKGSARSIKNFHLFSALLECRDFLDSFGGHSHAAGLLISKGNVEDFREKINLLAHERLSLEDLLPGLDIDMEVSLAQLGSELAQELEKLEPFGNGNPEPLFFTKGLNKKSEPQVLSRDTLKFWLTDGYTNMQAIGFGMGSLKDTIQNCDGFDLVYSLKLDNWQGNSSLILEIKDIFFRQ